MKKKTHEDLTCWLCKRSFMKNEGKLSLCPKCFNKYGSYTLSLVLGYGGETAYQTWRGNN